jgi:hypothetical protein
MVSVVLEACPEAAGVQGLGCSSDCLPFRSCLEEHKCVPTEPSWPCQSM